MYLLTDSSNCQIHESWTWICVSTAMVVELTECLRRCVFLTALAISTTAVAQRLPIEKISLPPGFEISVFADNVPNARAMAQGEQR